MTTEENNQGNEVQIRVQDPTKSPLAYVNIAEESLKFTYGGVEDALTLIFHRTIRVPDNKTGINALYPSIGEFPIYKVQVSLSVAYCPISPIISDLGFIIFTILLSRTNHRSC
ncbi:hypothetical protein F4801DRAFT_542506 [Xylaria longipes]|nr:hypothetical protein F4801DRAFT_542506 [Xylaria longipes]